MSVSKLASRMIRDTTKFYSFHCWAREINKEGMRNEKSKGMAVTKGQRGQAAGDNREGESAGIV